jgi:uroporphyrinogen III methyltransferase/synthase
MTKSLVYLIGAGPGDPGLISVRGLQCLATADVVLYDHLVHPRLLRHARADAETIDVGMAAPQPLEQEAICYLLAEKAREGKTVARLKWGDPFVFDRGGTEALFLHEQGVRFEVVPGIPAGIGAASYAGVPLTYPGAGDTLTFVRGHEDEGKTRASVDWASLARLDGTIVCYAGPDQLPQMLNALLTHGAHLRRHVAHAGDDRRDARGDRPPRQADRRPSTRGAHRGAGGRASRAPALVRRAPAVRPPHSRHPAA